MTNYYQSEFKRKQMAKIESIQSIILLVALLGSFIFGAIIDTLLFN